MCLCIRKLVDMFPTFIDLISVVFYKLGFFANVKLFILKKLVCLRFISNHRRSHVLWKTPESIAMNFHLGYIQCDNIWDPLLRQNAATNSVYQGIFCSVVCKGKLLDSIAIFLSFLIDQRRLSNASNNSAFSVVAAWMLESWIWKILKGLSLWCMMFSDFLLCFVLKYSWHCDKDPIY
jgi:hypothetical protein